MARTLGIMGVVALLAMAAAPAQAAQRCTSAAKVACLKNARDVEPVAVGPGGRVSRAAALQAYAAAVAPLPGVRVRRRATGNLFSGSGALRWALHYATPRQRRAVQARRRRARAASAPSAAQRLEWRGLVDSARERIEKRLGVTLTLAIDVELQSSPAKDGDTGAETGPDTTGDCLILVYPRAWSGITADDRKTVAAHEVFHCFELQIEGLDGYLSPDRPWLDEGGAQWAAQTIAQEWLGRPPTDPATVAFWGQYLRDPGKPLFERSYSAAGFFAHLAETGSDPWATLRGMLATKGAKAAYALAGSAFLPTWGTGFFRSPGLGSDWDTTGPGITSAAATPDELEVGVAASVMAMPRSAAIAKIELRAPIVELTAVKAHGRLRDADGVEIPLANGAYATGTKTAKCPGSGPELPRLARSTARLALAAHNDQAHVRLKGRTVDEYCDKPGVKPGAPTPPATTVFSNGAAGGSGECTVSADGTEFLALIDLRDPSGSLYVLQLDTSHFGGPGSYAATGRGVTSGPRVSLNHPASGRAWATETLQEGESGGGFTVNGDLRSGTVGATMRGVEHSGASGLVTANGTWRC